MEKQAFMGQEVSPERGWSSSAHPVCRSPRFAWHRAWLGEGPNTLGGGQPHFHRPGERSCFLDKPVFLGPLCSGGCPNHPSFTAPLTLPLDRSEEQS